MIHLLLKKEEMGRRVAIMAPRGKGLMFSLHQPLW